MPDPVPAIPLGQLAVDDANRGRRLGSGLVVDAARRALAAARFVAARAVVVQAVDERAGTFCKQCGSRPHSDRESLMPELWMAEIPGLP